MGPDLRLAIHHIGGRGGTGRFPALRGFEADLVNVWYEADESCIEEMRETARQHSTAQQVLPICAAGRNGTRLFYKLYNATASSIFKIDRDFKRSLPWLAESVVDYNERAWSTVQTSRIKAQKLDGLFYRARTPPAPMPDFMSINTQGSEAEILSGASTILREHGIAIQCEVSFRTIYSNQASFDEVTKQAAQLGFSFVRFMLHGVRGHGFAVRDDVIRTPIGLRGGGVQLQADAIYFKPPEMILKQHLEPMVDLLKGIFMGFVLDYMDYSYACAMAFLNRTSSKALLETEKSQYHYLAFVAGYLDELVRYPQIFPVTWTDLFPAGSEQPRESAAVREQYFTLCDKKQFVANVEFLVNPDFILVEKLAIQFGFDHQAELLRYARLSTIWDTLRRLGLVIVQEDGGARLDVDALHAI